MKGLKDHAPAAGSTLPCFPVSLMRAGRRLRELRLYLNPCTAANSTQLGLAPPENQASHDLSLDNKVHSLCEQPCGAANLPTSSASVARGQRHGRHASGHQVGWLESRILTESGCDILLRPSKSTSREQRSFRWKRVSVIFVFMVFLKSMLSFFGC